MRSISLHAGTWISTVSKYHEYLAAGVLNNSLLLECFNIGTGILVVLSLRIFCDVFLPRDAMLARYMPWPCVCVCHKSELY